MKGIPYIVLFIMLTAFGGSAQLTQERISFQINGSVTDRATRAPISGIEVATDKGEYTLTDALGEFKITVAVGDVLIIESPEIETVRYTIKDNDDVDVQVEGYSESSAQASRGSKQRSSLNKHRTYLDSASYYKKIDIEKSIDFVAQSISQLNKRGNKTELANSYSLLGEIYQFYDQYDLAISNFEYALEANKTSRTTLLLAKAYLADGALDKTEKLLLPLIEVKNMVPYQRIDLYESLGDLYRAKGETNTSVAYYNEGLTIARKNQVAPKLPDLNSKIADAYADDNRLQEAEAFYDNSLEQASKQAPQRAVKEREKVADFYNKKNQFDDEIKLRKQNKEELKKLPSTADNSVSLGFSPNDSITNQKINYKIARAYIAQDKYDEAIPYLEESIKEADDEDDLIVQKDATRKLSEVYERQGDFTRAFETYQKYVAVVDTLYVRKEQEISRAARFNREIAAKQSRITGLEQERELSQSKYDLALTEQQLIQETNKRQKWVIYSLLLGLTLTAIAAFFFYRSNKQQKLANNLLALKSLRSQMNPHFIFNALNSVNNYIAKNDERSANRYLSEFSTLMRAVLENSEEDFIPLSKELELLELYVKLEHSRFPEKFNYEIDLDNAIDVDAFKIPPMLLQPYIENAIWHGLRYKEEKGFLKIAIKQKNTEVIEIEISDNGIGRKKSAELKTRNQKMQKSKAMGNIKKRVAILNSMYKDKVAVTVRDLQKDETGTSVTLILKKN
ncbi:histidine kinase [Muriicola sp. Z0-33]|uniref:tetratricopeptide repeat-containing sensor histidine kinase n=1 Tax=Muriicola sp. Z0-33 TaxID=2816957 RepID=UPI0022376641|nr:histidine kinase [Muriicola sp. Z0-33]MCW5516209.1 histidine kinase [Muriicola sp. Z0-33]